MWLVMNKALQAIQKYAFERIQQAGLGDSDFRVLEALLHKGPLPVKTIGPKVNLTPGSISVAVDRLYSKGLVTRVEGAEDRRIRIVALTPRGTLRGGEPARVPVPSDRNLCGVVRRRR